ncbi:MAG: hypothetical protein IH977_11940 [Nitrospinae bacterium]|nr:hypothetical protein [Nitrospinota bacterium]
MQHQPNADEKVNGQNRADRTHFGRQFIIRLARLARRRSACRWIGCRIGCNRRRRGNLPASAGSVR